MLCICHFPSMYIFAWFQELRVLIENGRLLQKWRMNKGKTTRIWCCWRSIKNQQLTFYLLFYIFLQKNRLIHWLKHNHILLLYSEAIRYQNDHFSHFRQHSDEAWIIIWRFILSHSMGSEYKVQESFSSLFFFRSYFASAFIV